MPNKLSDDKQRISASLDKKLISVAKKKADELGISLTDLIKESLTDYIQINKDENMEKKEDNNEK